MTDPTKHAYFEGLMIAVSKGLFAPGKAYAAHIRHDDWCEWFAGGVCDCEVEIEIEEVSA